MDGTIYLGNELFPFTKDFLKKVEETGREYYFFTNNSSKSQRAYIEKLGKLGIMDAILKKGYQIPDDFSVCGFDNDFASSLLPISLTTVEHYMEDKGKKAFDMIYEKIQEKDDFFVQDDKCVILEDLSEITKMLSTFKSNSEHL